MFGPPVLLQVQTQQLTIVQASDISYFLHKLAVAQAFAQII